jgi:hypothetical protein
VTSAITRDAIQGTSAAEVLDLGYDPVATARAVRALRDAVSERGRVAWRGRIADGFDVAPLVHLPPPGAEAAGAEAAGAEAPGAEAAGAEGTGAEAAGADGIAAWRERYRYGLFYCRLGPGFATVKDQRRAEETERYVIDDPEVLDVFLRALAIVRLGGMGRRERAHAEMLWREGLLLRCEDVAVTLPMRLKKWPVPYSAI